MLVATCFGCDKEHPVGARPTIRGTTACPDCGDLRYISDVDERSLRDEADRIHDAVNDIHGVGEETRENIKDRFTTYDQLSEAPVETLKEIGGVGQKVAERIEKRAVK